MILAGILVLKRPKLTFMVAAAHAASIVEVESKEPKMTEYRAIPSVRRSYGAKGWPDVSLAWALLASVDAMPLPVTVGRGFRLCFNPQKIRYRNHA